MDPWKWLLKIRVITVFNAGNPFPGSFRETRGVVNFYPAVDVYPPGTQNDN
jgi:hypothetical protein